MTDLNKERELYEVWAFNNIENFIDVERDGMYYVMKQGSRLKHRDKEFLVLSSNRGWAAWQEKAKAQAVPEKKIYLTCEQLYAAANFGAPNKDPELLETELTIAWFDEAHSGSGYYVYISEYPEEGAMKLESESGAEG